MHSLILSSWRHFYSRRFIQQLRLIWFIDAFSFSCKFVLLFVSFSQFSILFILNSFSFRESFSWGIYKNIASSRFHASTHRLLSLPHGNAWHWLKMPASAGLFTDYYLPYCPASPRTQALWLFYYWHKETGFYIILFKVLILGWCWFSLRAFTFPNLIYAYISSLQELAQCPYLAW